MLADAVLLIHFAVVLFIVGGLPLIYLGAAFEWGWVRVWRWRALHLGAIGFVAAESVAGIVCPLTLWEAALRGQRPQVGFIEHWVNRIMYYDLPTWVFTLAYVGFAALVAVTWVAVPPIRVRRAAGQQQNHDGSQSL
jgi:hypothetical protein